MDAANIGTEEAVARLCRVFQPYLGRGHLEGCACCVSDADKRRLLAAKLELLTGEDLDRFAWKALTTWGGEEDLKRFLPRLLELIATEEPLPFDVEVLFGELRLGNWARWPEAERVALLDYFHALWRECLARPSGWRTPLDLLCALGQAVEDLQPFLAAWENCRHASGFAHLRGLIEDGLSNAFWSEALPQMGQVVAWLANPQTEANLQRIFDQNVEADFAEPLARAIDQLSWFRDERAAGLRIS